MYYNTDNFGDAIRSIRQSLKLTQKDVIDQTGINENTLRRLENGKTLPKQETLDLLSVVYKQDIYQVFLSCRMDDFGKYSELMEEIEQAFEASDTQWLSKCLEALSELNKNKMSPYYKRMLEQTICLLRGTIPCINRCDFEIARKNILSGLRLSIPNFDYNNFQDHLYNKIELHLLMVLGITENDLYNQALAQSILSHCVHMLDNTPELRKGVLPTKIYLNASYRFYVNGLYKESLDYAIQGIEYNNKVMSQSSIGDLYFRKGMAELKLNLDTSLYMESFKKAYIYLEALGREDLVNLMIKILKDRYNITLCK